VIENLQTVLILTSKESNRIDAFRQALAIPKKICQHERRELYQIPEEDKLLLWIYPLKSRADNIILQNLLMPTVPPAPVALAGISPNIEMEYALNHYSL